MDGCLSGCLSFLLLLIFIGFLGIIGFLDVLLQNPILCIFLLLVLMMYMCSRRR